MYNIQIRRATPNDFPQLTNLLRQLTTVGNPNKNKISNNVYNNIYVAYLVQNKTEIIVGCSTILIENKIIHEGGKVGHIEDVVIHNKYRKRGIGKLLVDHCVKVGKKMGCYKIILDCDRNNTGFYEKCGFKQLGICMRMDL